MLRRRPTRIELKPEDKEEWESIQALKAQAAASEAGASTTKTVEKPRTTSQRIGLQK